MHFRHLCAIIAGSCVALLSNQFSVQADTANFYRGKTLEILVGFPPGGGYDLYARALARTFGTHLPGAPQVIVRNFPGAGSLRLAKYLLEAAPRDGLSIGLIDPSLLVASLLKDNVDFDASKLRWVGAASKDLQVCSTWGTSPVKQVADLRVHNAVFGATGQDDIRYVSEDVLRKVIESEAKTKIVTGYPGNAEIRLAMEKGELDGTCESWSSLKSQKLDWVRSKQINMLVQLGLNRLSDLPDVPTIGDYARSDIERQALNLIFSPSQVNRPFGTPPAVPDDRLTALRRAFDATMKDPEFLAETDRLKLDVDPSTGEEVESFLKTPYSASDEVLRATRKLLQ